MNILAKRKGSQIADADAVPTLFFIECTNIDEDVASLCCPILEPSKDAGMLLSVINSGLDISFFLTWLLSSLCIIIILLKDAYSVT
jgi:hypothetical protein